MLIGVDVDSGVSQHRTCYVFLRRMQFVYSFVTLLPANEIPQGSLSDWDRGEMLIGVDDDFRVSPSTEPAFLILQRMWNSLAVGMMR